jgi:tRNA(Ile2) C34 agmatinyltransferase TiaS
MIFVGMDDTDVKGSPGTNHLARRLAGHLSDRYRCHMILRHQLLFDPRVPYTSKNSSATLVLSPLESTSADLDALFDEIAELIVQLAADGSDPGLCLGTDIPASVTEYGGRCKVELSDRAPAQRVAEQAGLRLAGLGGTHDGIIGALAAVGLAASGNDGRVVLIEGRDDLAGVCSVADLTARRVEVRCHDSQRTVDGGWVDVGKHLRPNLRGGKIVQFACPPAAASGPADVWTAVRVP